MHTLSELKALFLQNDHKIKEFSGWYLIVGKDRYTMLNDQYHLNGEIIKRKDLVAKTKEKPKAVFKRKPAKMRAAKKKKGK